MTYRDTEAGAAATSIMLESVAWRAFIREWFRRHGEERVTATQLFEFASIPGELYDDEGAEGYPNILADILGKGSERSRMTRLGRELNGVEGCTCVGYKVVRVGAQNGRTVYRLIRVE